MPNSIKIKYSRIAYIQEQEMETRNTLFRLRNIAAEVRNMAKDISFTAAKVRNRTKNKPFVAREKPFTVKDKPFVAAEKPFTAKDKPFVAKGLSFIVSEVRKRGAKKRVKRCKAYILHIIEDR
jgi:hypothetical protein